MKVQSRFIEMFGDPMTNSKGWSEHGKINKYAQIILGSTPNSKEASYWDGDIKWITPAEMTEESYYIYDTERHVTEEGVNSASLTLLPYRSVLFSTRAPIGKVGLVGSPMYCNQGFKNFICGNQLNPVYLYYSLIYKREYLVSLGTGTTFKELSKKTVEGLELAIPPFYLQEQFEKIYDQADKSKFVGFKSRFIEMFGTIDEPKVEVKKLIDVVLSSGQYGSNTSATDYQEGKPRYIRITDINDDGSLNDDIKTAEVIEDKYRLIPGDIVFARTGATVGKTYMHETGNAIYAGYLIMYQMNESKMKPAFMKAFTHSKTYYNWVANSQKVGAQPNISAAQYDNMPVLVPQIEKQEEFLAICHQADKSKYYYQIA